MQDFDRLIGNLNALPNDHERLRPYQVPVNEATEGSLSERKREMLLAMATGNRKDIYG